MKKIIWVLLLTLAFSCKKEVTTPTSTSYSFDKSMFVDRWWYTDYSRTSGFAEYKGRYFASNGTLKIDRGNYGLGIITDTWSWGVKDSINSIGCIKNLTNDSLAVYWNWQTFGSSGPSGFMAYYSRK